MVDKVLESYQRWITQTAREHNVKNDEIEDIVKGYYNLTKG